MAEIWVGAATLDITPGLGLPLMGNFRDDYAARGAHDPLRARAMVFADRRGVKAALLAVDVCMLDRHNVARMRDAIGSQSDVPPQNVWIHATHTHSAPAVAARLGMEPEIAPHQAEIDALLDKAASAVALADRASGGATLCVGSSREDRVSFNRRLKRRDGTTQMNWEALQDGFDPSQIVEPWGPTDPQLSCLVIQQQGQPAAAVINFALHPAILAGDNWLYSADYPGYLAEALSRTVGDGLHWLFLNGCCGDVNHVDYRDRLQGRGYQMAQRVGYMLGAAAHQAINSRKATGGDRVCVSRRMVSLPRLRISPEERARCQRVLDEAGANPPPGQVDGVPDAYYAKLRLDMWSNQDDPDQVEVMAMRIGDAALVGLPGEAFCQLGLEIKRRSPAQHTLVAGLSNDAIGYLPTRDAFEQGGYETASGSTFYQPGAAERLVESAVEQLDQLFSSDT
jgi:hypothetical protein